MSVVAWCRVLVGVSGGSSWSGSGGFRCSGGAGGLCARVPKPSPHAGGCKPLRGSGFLPRVSQVGGEVAGEAELGVGGQQQPDPPVGSGRVAKLRAGPAEGLLEHADGRMWNQPPQKAPRHGHPVRQARGPLRGDHPRSGHQRVAVTSTFPKDSRCGRSSSRPCRGNAATSRMSTDSTSGTVTK